MGKPNKKEYPAPKALATTTNLTKDEAHKVTEALAGLTADALALYVKTKNFHWHVAGPHFRSLHLLFDEHAAEILAMVDPLAERARKIGGTTIRSISHIESLTRVDDDNQEYVEAKDMVQRLIDDNKTLDAHLREAHSVADEANDKATTSLLENYMDETQQRIWFLFETYQGM